MSTVPIATTVAHVLSGEDISTALVSLGIDPTVDRIAQLQTHINASALPTGGRHQTVVEAVSLALRNLSADAAPEQKPDAPEAIGLYVISGRVPGDDDDTVEIVTAANAGEADASFRESMTADQSDDEREHLIEVHGSACMIISTTFIGHYSGQGGLTLAREFILDQVPAVQAEPVNPDLFADTQRKMREREALAESLLANASAEDTFTFVRDGDRSAIAEPDPMRPGGFRLVRFDGDGAVGHIEAKTMRDAVLLALREGYRAGDAAPVEAPDILPDDGSVLSVEPNTTGETPWRGDVRADTFVRLTDRSGTTLAMIWASAAEQTLQVEYAEVREDARRRGVYGRLLARLSEQYTIVSDEPHNNAVKRVYEALGAREMRSGRMMLDRKRPLVEATKQAVQVAEPAAVAWYRLARTDGLGIESVHGTYTRKVFETNAHVVAFGQHEWHAVSDRDPVVQQIGILQRALEAIASGKELDVMKIAGDALKDAAARAEPVASPKNEAASPGM